MLPTAGSIVVDELNNLEEGKDGLDGICVWEFNSIQLLFINLDLSK